MRPLLFLFLAACSENGLNSTKVTEGGEDSQTAAPDIVVTPAEVDFGAVSLGKDGIQTLTISNVGSAPLLVTDFVLADASQNISWSAPESLLVPQGSSTDVVLTWSPAIVGDLATELRVLSDDPDESAVDVPLTGTVITGELLVEPLSWDFGNVDVGAASTLTVQVSNIGAGALQITDARYTTVDGDLSVLDYGGLAATPVWLQSGESTQVQIGYSPSSAGGDEGALQIASNDPINPLTVATQLGNGVSDPCNGLTKSVELFITADDSWRGWLDGTSFSGPNQDAWNQFDTVTWELGCGDHALALYAKDTGMAISGVIAVIRVDGVVRFVSEPTHWTMTNVTPPASWTDVTFDDSAWTIPSICSDLSPWGSTPQPFYDLGASWIWWTSDCQSLGEAWLRLNFTVP